MGTGIDLVEDVDVSALQGVGRGHLGWCVWFEVIELKLGRMD